MIPPIIAKEQLPVNDESQKITIQRGKHDKERPFVYISKAMLRDIKLSPRNKGVLCYLLSLPDDWITHPRQVAESLGISKNQMYSVLKDLIILGYATKEEIKCPKGRFTNVCYCFYEDKLTIPQVYKEKNTVSQNPDTDNPDTEKGTLQKNDHTEDILKQIKPHNTPISPEVAIAPEVEVEKAIEVEKPKRAKVEFSPKVREVATEMINIIAKHNPVYRPPPDLSKFLYQVAQMIEVDQQDPVILIKAFEWCVADNEERGTFKGWQGVICTNKKGGKVTTPAEIFRTHYSKIYSQMSSQPKRKFAASSSNAEALKIAMEMTRNAI